MKRVDSRVDPLDLVAPAVCLVGAIGPWRTLLVVSASGLDFTEGKIVAVAAFVMLIVAVVASAETTRKTALFGAFLVLVVAGATLLDPGSVEGVRTGWGVWVALIGGLLAVAIARRPRGQA
jgi:membrane-bound ClpP family serine protease